MNSSLFPHFITLYESFSARVLQIIEWGFAFALAASVCAGALCYRKSPLALKLMIISGAILCFIVGATASSSIILSRICLISGHALTLVYIAKYHAQLSFSATARSSTSTWLALTIILISGIFKLTALEAWPPLINDYAAMTGYDVVKLAKPGFLNLFLTPVSPYLQGGGTSALHAPLVQTLFLIFGHTNLAIRLAEVISSFAVLGFLWLVLRNLLSPTPALLALGLFAFSSEHLSQSRVGTFYSISQAIALATLWLWIALEKALFLKLRYIFALVIATCLAALAYAPTRAIFLFTGIMFIRACWYHRYSRRTVVVAAIITLGLLFISYGSVYLESPFKGFGGPLRALATDSPIWFKEPTGRVHNSIQSFGTMVSNISANVIELFASDSNNAYSWEKLYLWCLSVITTASFVGFLIPRMRTISIYGLCGFLPLLLVFPLMRRGVLIRPLIPAIVALFLYEYVSILRLSISWRFLRLISTAFAGASLLVFPLQGIYFFAKQNGPVGVAPGFGPLYAHDYLEHLKSLSNTCSLVILNPSFGVYKYKMGLVDHVLPDQPAERTVFFEEIAAASPIDRLLTFKTPICLGILNEEYRRWIVPWLTAKIPGISIEEFRSQDTKELQFWIATYPGPPSVGSVP